MKRFGGIGVVVNDIVIGMLGSNCYVIGANNQVAIIDAGADAKQVGKALEQYKSMAKYIILTHGHIDHICCLDELCEATKAEVIIHESEKDLLLDPEQNFSSVFGDAYCFDKPVTLVKDNDRLEIGGIKLEIMHTPGHSKGSICIKLGNSIFTGDTLFKGTIGRTDMRNSDFDHMKESIARLMLLEDYVNVYPGHGESTTIGEERIRPYMRYL